MTNKGKDNLFELAIWQIFALRVMVQWAKFLGVRKGVAFVYVEKRGSDLVGQVRFQVVEHTIQRNPRNKDDKGTNYFGIAMEKLAVMMATGFNSGTLNTDRGIKNGETPYRGGKVLTIGDYRIYTGFSGGTENEDVQIAECGMNMMTADEAKG